MKEELNITYKPNIAGTSKQLIISKESIQLNSVGKEIEKVLHFDKRDVAEYRFGMKWIRGYAFTIGREYQIFIKDWMDRVIKISFKSIYGYRKNELHERYSKIIRALWDHHLTDIASAYYQQISKGETVHICGVEITNRDITIESQNILNKKKIVIPWELLGTQEYHTYYALFSIENPAELNCTYNYLDDWNAGLLFSVIETIKRHHSMSLDKLTPQ